MALGANGASIATVELDMLAKGTNLTAKTKPAKLFKKQLLVGRTAIWRL